MNIFNKLSSIKAIQLFQLFRFGAVFATGIILAKKGFTTEAISQYETFLFITYAFTFFWLSGITNSFLSIFPKTENSEKPKLLFNTFLLMFAFAGVAALFISGFSFSNLFQVKYLGLLVGYLLLNTPACLNEYILLAREENKTLSIYGIASFLVHVALITAAVFTSEAIETVLYGLLIIGAVKFGCLMYLLLKHAAFHFSFQQQKQLGGSGIPLALSYLLSGSAEVIDSFLVKHFYSENEFAIYRYGAREFPIVLLMANAFSSAAIPKVAANLDEGLALIKENSLKLFNSFFPLTLLLMFSSKYLFQYVFNVDFVQSAAIFNIYLLLIISRLLFPQTVLNGLGKNNFLVVSAFLETVLNVGLSLILMNKMGITGIAFATVIANLFDKLLLVGYLKYKLKIEPERYILVSQYIFYSGLLLIVLYLLSI